MQAAATSTQTPATKDIARQAKVEWRRKTIGPDDWYNDDFNFDKGQHLFSDDPTLNRQYGELLDLQYQGQMPPHLVAHHERILRHESNPHQLTRSVQVEQMRSRPKRTLKEEGRSVTWHADKFKEFHILGKRDKDVLLRLDMDPEAMRAQPQRRRSEDKVAWSPVKAFDEIRKRKEAPPKNLVQDRLKAFQNAAEAGVEQMHASKRSASSSGFSLEDIGAALQSVEKDEDDVFESDSNAQREAKQLIRVQKQLRESFFDQTKISTARTSSSAEESSDEKPLPQRQEPIGMDCPPPEQQRERKRSVKELLSDFEKKSKEIQDKDNDDEITGNRRRVFSDTETMLYETSSDDVASVDEPKRVFVREDSNATVIFKDDAPDSSDEASSEKQPHDQAPSLPPRLPKERANDEDADERSVSRAQEAEYLPMDPPLTRGKDSSTSVEGQYLTMTPPKLPANNGETPSKRFILHAFSRESVTSSAHGSTPSISNDKLGGEVGNLTPTEMLIRQHTRTPSQSMVLEHLQKEFGTKARLAEDMYVEMNDDGSAAVGMIQMTPRQSVLAPPASQTPSRPADSPRYCEIDEVDERSHYEYLYKARSATPLHYEVVYQEIPDEETTPEKVQPKKPVEGLPDIVGDAPTNRGNTSSDADDESPPNPQMSNPSVNLSDSFIPASFFLNQHKRSSSQDKASSQLERRGSQGSVGMQRDLPLTPTEARRSAEDIASRNVMGSYSDGSGRGSISSIDSAGRARMKHLENILEVSNTMERRESRRHGISCQQSQQPSGYPTAFDEEGEQLEHVSVPSEPSVSVPYTETLPTAEDHPVSPRSKVPYYVSDIVGQTLIDYGGTDTLERAQAIDRLQVNMEVLDAETDHHLSADSNAAKLMETIRSAQPTPQVVAPSPCEASGLQVARANSLEGLLGDAPGGPRESVTVQVMPADSSHSHPSSYAPTPTSLPPPQPSLPARGREPPPPPANVPPLDPRSELHNHPYGSSSWGQEYDEEDDEQWRQSLRRASARQRARSTDPSDENRARATGTPIISHSRTVTMSPLTTSGTTSLAQGSRGHTYHRYGDRQQPPQQQPPGGTMAQSYISGYVWDESEQRFYKLNDPSSPPNERLMDPSFLDEGLPSHDGSKDPRLGRPQEEAAASVEDIAGNSIFSQKDSDDSKKVEMKEPVRIKYASQESMDLSSMHDESFSLSCTFSTTRTATCYAPAELANDSGGFDEQGKSGPEVSVFGNDSGKLHTCTCPQKCKVSM